MEQPIEHGGDGGGVTEQLAPVIDRTVRGQDGRDAFVAPHDEFEKIFGCRGWQFAHAKIVDDQERDFSQLREEDPSGSVQRGVGDFLDEGMCLSLEYAMALLNGCPANGLCQVTLAGSRRAKEERVFALRDKARRGQVVDQGAIHLLVEIKVEAVE